MTPAEEILPVVLAAYGLTDAAAAPLGAGLINQTFLVEARSGARAVLQRVNRIFSPAIHENIRAVTDRVAAAGLATPRLLPTREGALHVDRGDGGLWRLMTWIDGVSFDVVGSAAQAHAAGRLVGRFHAALEGLPHAFVGLRAGVHDTDRHRARLAEAMATLAAHRLHGEVAPLAAEIEARARALPPLPALPAVVGHGDLKFNNVLFRGPAPPASDEAVCLIDLDTVGPQALAFELGDAWRSWCNRAGEDEPEAILDLAPLRASLEGYRDGRGRALAEPERRALLLGVEWVSLELSARFAADALFEAYFGWDPARVPGRGEHNLVRARGQLSLHRALAACRPERAALLALPAS